MHKEPLHSLAAALRYAALCLPRCVCHPGNTRRTLEPWVRASSYARLSAASGAGSRTSPARPVICDLTFVDGDHEGQGARKDIQTLARVAAANNKLVVDDIHLG